MRYYLHRVLESHPSSSLPFCPPYLAQGPLRIRERVTPRLNHFVTLSRMGFTPLGRPVGGLYPPCLLFSGEWFFPPAVSSSFSHYSRFFLVALPLLHPMQQGWTHLLSHRCSNPGTACGVPLSGLPRLAPCAAADRGGRRMVLRKMESTAVGCVLSALLGLGRCCFVVNR